MASWKTKKEMWNNINIDLKKVILEGGR